MSYDVTLITPTGDRPEAFELCETWMVRQDFSGRIQWIVVDDGTLATRVTYGQHYVRRVNDEGEPCHTLALNLLVGLKHVLARKILIIEDDDWYGRQYVRRMVELLDRYELVGDRIARYFNVKQRRWRMYFNLQRASLCQTGFRSSLCGLVGEGCLMPDMSRVNTRRIWMKAKNKLLFRVDAPLCVGIKGMPGRPGIGVGHKARFFRSDPKLLKLRDWLDDDAYFYERYWERA